MSEESETFSQEQGEIFAAAYRNQFRYGDHINYLALGTASIVAFDLLLYGSVAITHIYNNGIGIGPFVPQAPKAEVAPVAPAVAPAPPEPARVIPSSRPAPEIIFRRTDNFRLRELQEALGYVNANLFTEEDRDFYDNLVGQDTETLTNFWRKSRIEGIDIGGWNVRLGPNGTHRLRIITAYESAGVATSETTININSNGIWDMPPFNSMPEGRFSSLWPSINPVSSAALAAYNMFNLPPKMLFYSSPDVTGSWKELGPTQGKRGIHVYPDGKMMVVYVDENLRGQLVVTERFHNPNWDRTLEYPTR